MLHEVWGGARLLDVHDLYGIDSTLLSLDPTIDHVELVHPSASRISQASLILISERRSYLLSGNK